MSTIMMERLTDIFNYSKNNETSQSFILRFKSLSTIYSTPGETKREKLPWILELNYEK